MNGILLAAACVCVVYLIVLYRQFGRTPASPDWPEWTR